MLRLLCLLTLLVAACRSSLPPTIVVDDVVANLDAREPDASDAGVHTAVVAPGDPLRGEGGRPARITPPGTAARWRVAVPERGILRFAIGVEGDGRRDSARAAIRFTVTVDDTQIFTRDVNPSATRHDRRW